MKRRVGLVFVTMVGLLGAATRAQAEPAWCKGSEGNRVSFNSIQDLLTTEEPHWALPGLVGALCYPNAEARSEAKKLEEARQRWSKRYSMNDDDWFDLAAWATWSQSDRNGPTLRMDGKRAWSSYDALDQYIALMFDLQNDYDANYLADAMGARLSEAGRMGYISWCMRSFNKEVQWAMCQPDVNAFDPQKVLAELRADNKKHTPFERVSIRLALFALPEKLKEYKARVKEGVEKDPAYGKMLQIADATRKEWDTLWRTDAALLELAATMDDARVSKSRRAMEGCEEKTWAAWKAAVAGIPAKKFSGIQRDEIWSRFAEGLLGVVAGDVEGYLSASALNLCKGGEKADPLVRVIGGVLERWPGFRGPRNATASAILGAGLELDERGASIDYPEFNRPWYGRNGGSSGGGSGTISALKPQGDKVRVEFAAQMEKQFQCAQTKRTNRITQIRSDGTLVYETLCLKETTVSVNRAPEPQTIKAMYAPGLKPGMSVMVIEDAVIIAWPKAGVSTPSVIGGVAVK